MKLAVWGYTSYSGRRFIGLMAKGKFVEQVSELHRGGGKGWIRENMCDTGNKDELKLAHENPGRIVEVNRFNELVKVHKNKEDKGI